MVKYLAVAILLLSVAHTFAQAPDVEWRHTYVSPRGDAEGWMVQETRDNGYIIIGQNGGDNGFDFDIYLIKNDSLGDTVWTRSFDPGTNDWGRAIRQTLDGGYALAGYSYNSNSSNDFYLRKIDSLGNNQWRHIYQLGTNDDDARSLELIPDGGYIMAGSSYRVGNHYVFVIKTDSIGDTVWTNRYGGPNNDKAWSIKNTLDGNFIIVGWSDVPAEYSQIYILKINGDGDTLWTRKYGTSYNDEGRDILELPDHRLIVVGKYGAPASRAHAMVLCLNENGDSLWASVFDSNYEATAVSPTFDGGFIMCGFNYSNNIYKEFVRKTDASGNSLWDISGNDSTYAHCIIQTSDSGYVFVGYASDSLSITKLNPERPTIINTDDKYLPYNLNLYNHPNPFNSATAISYDLPQAEDISLSIFDIQGRKITTLISGRQSPGKHTIIWNAQDLSSGIYFYTITAAKITQIKSCVLLK